MSNLMKFESRITEILDRLSSNSENLYNEVRRIQSRLNSLVSLENVAATLEAGSDELGSIFYELEGDQAELNELIEELNSSLLEDDEEDEDDELDIEEEDEEEFEFEDDEAEIIPRVITDNLDPKPTDTTYPFPEEEGTKES